ncbi:MAG TPA: caspase family protein [Polyangia bacterium]|nr:caspase family protein [Polyangia bacterium]
MNRLLTSLAITALIATAVPPRAAAAGAPSARLHRYALLIGVADGGPGRPRLRYAATDAQAVGRVLQTLGGVAAADAVFVADGTRAAIDAGFAQIETRLRAEGAPGVRRELLVYYSGHSDEEGLLVGRDRYPYDELRTRVQRASADLRVVILDSCASGAFTRHKGGVKRPPFLMDSSIDMRGHAFLTSTSADEQAQESDRIAASYFTYYLLSGLRGAADANQDRRVTLQEAYQFASQETLARTERTQGGPQHAAYEFDLTGTGDMVVTDVRGTESGLVLPPELSGRITVRQRDGALIAELHKAAGSTLELGVEPGDYVVSMEGAPQIFQAELALVAGQRAAVRASAFHAGPARELTVARGDAPAGAPAASVTTAAPAEPVQTVPVKAVLFPGATDGKIDVDGFSFGFIADRARRVAGLQLSLGYNQVDQQLRGFQLSIGANGSGGDTHGGQIAVGANVATGSMHGAQLAVGANVAAEGAHGAQIATGANVAGGQSSGAQIAAGLNIANEMRGVQIAAGANFAVQSNGAQLAPLNIVRSGAGAQIGVANVAGEGSGARIGVLNFAARNHGFQLGVVNVAAHDDGESLALLNLIGDGIHEAAVYATELMVTNVGLKLGGRHLYTNLAFGYQPGDDLPIGPAHFTRSSRRWAFAPGLGWRFPLERGPLRYLEVEADSAQIRSNWSWSGDTPQVASLRAQVGVRIFRDLSVLAGAGASVAIGTGGQDADLGFGPQSVSHSGATTVRIYPSLLLGLQI